MQERRARSGALIAILAGFALIGASCAPAAPASPATGPAAEDLTIYVVGCAAPTGFHGYIARASEEAGRNLGVRVV